MKHIVTIIYIIVYSGIAFLLSLGLADMYLKALHGQSGLVMAKDEIEVKAIPYFIAFMVGFLTYKIRTSDNDE